MEGYAFGVMGISYNDYYTEMTLRNVVNAFRASNKQMLEESTDKWRMTRHLSMLYYNSKAERRKQIQDPAQYMRLPGDKLPKPKELTAEQIEKLFK